MKIRAAQEKDFPQMLEIYARARQFMRDTGNPEQWKDTNPQPDIVLKGIRSGKAYLAVAEGTEEDGTAKGEILGTFYFALEEEPTYRKITDGNWKNEDDYGVIHRIASSGKGKGFASAAFAWCGACCLEASCRNLRIDTHQDNRIMQHVLEKNGFSFCGKIYLADGSMRLAYQKCL